MKHILCVRLKNWPITVATRRRPEWRRGKPFPLVVVRTVADRQIIITASEAAEALGIHCNMTLVEARALHASVQSAEHQPLQDSKALESLARWMMRFSPCVSIEREHGYSLFLDLTGSERLFDGFENLVQLIRRSLKRIHVAHCLALAPTPGAAWALAFSGQDGAIVDEWEIESALAPLPSISLRIDDDIAASLSHLGLSTIGDVMHLPRELLPARFGTELLRRIDQAVGYIAEPLCPIEYQAPIQAQMDFDGVVTSLETIQEVFRELLTGLTTQLARKGCGARVLQAEFLRDRLPSLKRSIHLSRPSRDPVNLFRLLQCSLDGLTTESGMKVHGKGRRSALRAVQARSCADSDHHYVTEGFSGVCLSCEVYERIVDVQAPLLEHEDHEHGLELDHLIERLRARLGEESVVQTELIEAYLPEKASRIRPIADRKPKKNHRQQHLFPSGPVIPRPLQLLDPPREIQVIVRPSNDAEGRPASFTHEDKVHRVTEVIGAERIEGCWWEGHQKTRDYYDVQDQHGRHFWVFRVAQNGRWFIHGSW